MSHDHVGPVVCEEVSRTVDDVTNEVVCVIAVDVEHARTNPRIGSA